MVKQLQGFASIAQLLPQLVVDNLLPEEQKKALLEKLCPAEIIGTRRDSVTNTIVVVKFNNNILLFYFIILFWYFC